MGKANKVLKFEEAMRRLDEIVRAMESGEIGVEDSIAQYEEAMRLASHCRQILDTAEQRIQKIQLDAAGRPQTTPFQTPGQATGEVEPDEDGTSGGPETGTPG
jgi:exodeoxyribonuclease VII small subunit